MVALVGDKCGIILSAAVLGFVCAFGYICLLLTSMIIIMALLTCSLEA